MKLTTGNVVPEVIRYEAEKSFVDPKTGKSEEFPFLRDSSSVTLSVVVPAYNEELRCKMVFISYFLC